MRGNGGVTSLQVMDAADEFVVGQSNALLPFAVYADGTMRFVVSHPDFIVYSDDGSMAKIGGDPKLVEHILFNEGADDFFMKLNRA